MHWSAPVARIDQLTTVRGTTLAWTTVMAMCVPLVATVAAAPLVDVALIGLSGGFAACGGALAYVRRRALQLPLRLSDVACRGLLGGVRVYRFRACLGRGRAFSRGVASVEYMRDDLRVSLPVTLSRIAQGVGPWTLVVTDPDHVVSGEGHFMVEVQMQEGTRRWKTEQRYPVSELLTGVFGTDVAMSPAGLRVDPDAWDVVGQEAWT